MSGRPGLRVLVQVPALLALVAVATISAPAQEGIAGQAGRAAVTAVERADPRIHLQDGRELPVTTGERAGLRLMESGAPLSLASADFDEDGVPDLLAGYGVKGGGVLKLWRGNEDSIHPNGVQARSRRERGESTGVPFLTSELSFELPASPELIVAGDFDDDGHADVLFATRGSSRLYLLSGNGRGGFARFQSRDLPGAVTAMVAGVLDPRGARLGVAVAVVAGRSPSLLLFGPEPLLETPDVIALPAPASALAVGRLDDDLFPDLVAATGSEVLLVHGRAGAVATAETEAQGDPGPAVESRRVERRSLAFTVTAVAIGAFGPGSREGVALLAESGRSYLLTPREDAGPVRGNVDGAMALSRPVGQAAAPSAFFPGGATRQSARTTRAADLKSWDLTEIAGDPVAGGRALIAARLSGSAADDLVVLDAGANRIHVVSAGVSQSASTQSSEEAGSARTEFALAASLEVAGSPVAVLPMRLNPDAASDLVVLRTGSIAPAVVLTTSGLTFAVNSTGDTSDVSPGNGVCANSSGDCTLRAAIQESNATVTADTINFAISGAGVHLITVGSALPNIIRPVTIDGTTQSDYAGKPLIELTGPAGGGASGLLLQTNDCVVRGLAINGFNSGIGIYLYTPGATSNKNAIIEANFIGTDATGTIAKPNHVGVGSLDSSLSTIGGTTAAARNLISGNSYLGVEIFGLLAVGNVIQGNYVGTDVTGASILFNSEAGVYIFADNTTVGGDVAGAGNLISGNGDPATNTTEGHGGGIDMGVACGNPPSCTIIFGNNAVVKGNKIGTNAAGTAAVPNLQHGIRIFSPGSPNATIGSTSLLGRNLISGNGKGGIIGADFFPTVTNVRGNFIGTDVTGAAALGNQYASPGGTPAGIVWIVGTANTVQIVVGGSGGTTPGGPCTGSCNLISANDPVGILVTGPGLVSIFNNFIGTNAAGTAALGNVQGGVVMQQAPKILGSSLGTGNVISGNGDALFGGFGVLSQSTASPGHTINGNLIGTNAAGTAALPNFGDGVILGASDTLGSVTDPNVISGNAGNGVSIPSGGSFARVLGNFIGARSNGAALQNGFDGVITAASDGVIQSNQIAHNPGNGVTVTGSGVRNAIRFNAIHHNTGLGIDLGGDGVTANDAGDPDTGPNDLMNFPEGVSAVWDPTANQTVIRGQIDTSSPNTAVIDLFANSKKDISDHGQGEVYLGSATPDADGRFCLTYSGLLPFSPLSPPAGTIVPPPWVSATATNVSGSTSEFSSTTTADGVELIALEVNQTIQDWTNSIPLVSHKPTYVRAHIQTSNPASPAIPVTVQLRGFIGASELAGSPLTPINYGVYPAQPNAVSRRHILNSSANFRLPEAWLAGPIQLRLERTDGAIACQEPADASAPGQCSDCRTSVTFSVVPEPSIQLIAVKYQVGATIFDFGVPELDRVARIVKAHYPVAELDWTPGTLDWIGRRVPASGASPGFEDVITAALRTNWFADLYGNTIYFGVLPGMGGGVAAAIPARMGSGGMPLSFSGYGRATPSHEIGHTLGRSHTVPSTATPAVCGTIPGVVGKCNDCSKNPPESGFFPNFFPVTSPSSYSSSGDGIMPTLGPMNLGQNRLIYGLDTSEASPTVIDPNIYFDLMSYCAVGQLDMWTSDWTYNGLRNSITATFGSSRQVQTQASQASQALQTYLVVQGRVNFVLPAVQLLPLSSLTSPSTPPSDPAGSYLLRLLNGAGGVVAERSFEPVRFEGRGADANTGMFWVAVTPDPSIRKVVVLKDGVVLASRTASAQAPTVAVVFPNGGETVTQDPVTLQWTGGDGDGDPLTYDVQFSTDGGTTWRMLVSDLPFQTYSIPRAFLKATVNALLRVTAKDGFWSTSDQSNAVFTVANNPPFVSLLAPTVNQSFTGSQQIVFEASARDTEQGRLSGTSLQWTSSIDGALGSGKTLLKQANQLTAGNHTITVTATDSAAAFSSASVNISISAAPPPAWADLAVAQEAAPNSPSAGAPVIYTLTVTNAGRDPATSATLTDTLPAGVTFGSANASQGSCNRVAQTVTCNLGTLAADATATVTIAVTFAAPGPITNAASVGAFQFDPVPANNTASDSATVLPAAPTVSNPANQTVCPGASAVFSATGSGTGPLTYRWRKNGFDLSDGGSVSGSATATLTINPVAAEDAGQYDLAVTDGYGQGVVSATALLTITPPSSGAIGASGAVCANRAGNRASVPSAGAGATYAWSITNGTITGGAGTSGITFTSGPSGLVHLHVVVTNSCGAPQTGDLDLPITSCTAEPRALHVDAAPDGGLSNGNGILEPGETVVVKPFWKNLGGSPLSLSGTGSFTGPAGAAYTLNDSFANYGSIAAGATNDCATATGNCYEVSVSSPPTRPATHWDAALTETLSDGDPAWVWPLHIGQSFTDVPKNHVFYSFVERILHNGVTTGCTANSYCPDATVFRLQMAVFIARAQAGGDANIPVSGSAQGNPYNCVAGGQSQFTDIDPANPFCRHVHYLFSTGVTTGCVTTPPRQYCPADNVSRGQMALFIARAVAGSDAAVPVTYGPDPVTGRSYSCNAGSPNLHFTDIATSDIFCRHTHYLWAKDVISGFPDGTFGPALFVTRGAMAKFLANGFNLILYKP